MIQGGKVSIIIVLPNEIDGLSEVEKKLGNITFNELRNYAHFVKVMLHLPKFRIESTIELNDVLSEVS